MNTAKPTPESTIVDVARRFFGPEIRSWRGEQRLSIVFWGYGVAVSLGLVTLYCLSLLSGRLGLQQALLVCFASYTFWLLVALWRCSASAAHTLGGVLVRHLIVVWAINTVLTASFLEVDLVRRSFDVAPAMKVSVTPAQETLHADPQ